MYDKRKQDEKRKRDLRKAILLILSECDFHISPEEKRTLYYKLVHATGVGYILTHKEECSL